MSLKGTLGDGTKTPEELKALFDGLAADQKGETQNSAGGEILDGGGCPRGWIVNGCYWCGADSCVNPGWLMARCHRCGGSYFVSR